MKSSFWKILPVAGFVLLWEAAARSGVSPGGDLFPPFSKVVAELVRLAGSGVLAASVFSSLLRVLAGFAAGAVVGISLGILLGRNAFLYGAFHPVLSLLYPIPALGWLPVLMLWFGIGEALPVAIIFLCSFLPLLYNTVTGVRGVPAELVAAAEMLGASRTRILATVVIPLALPNIFTGLRLEAGMAWRVIIAAEMVAIPTGIGALMLRAESLVRMDIVLACLMVLSVMCLASENLFLFLERRLTRQWR